jgi:hypothetical protein
VFLYSGTDKKVRAKQKGVGIVMEQGYRQKVVEWEPVNSRIIRINMKLEQKIPLIQKYAPTQDSEEIETDIFYNLLQQTVLKPREYTRHVVVMGEWNAILGDQICRATGTIGLYPAQSIYNGNGDRMINFCIDNHILIGNMFFPHNKVHKVTSEAERTQASSTIDYNTFSKTMRYAVNDVRVDRSAQLSTHHKLPIIKLRLKPLKIRQEKPHTKIKIHQLENREKKTQYQEHTADKLDRYEEQILETEGKHTLQRTRITIKESLTEEAREICGQTTVGNRSRRTKR